MKDPGFRLTPRALACGLLLLVCGTMLIQQGVAEAKQIKSSCKPPTSKKAGCTSAIVTGALEPEAPGEHAGLSPTDLREAYDLPIVGGAGQTVAIVDAYSDPAAESDLDTYRTEYHLGACTTTNGCFERRNQRGEAGNYPAAEVTEWTDETSLDVDMVSAVCPECHITLVEAETNALADMAAAVKEAGELPETTEISNSWGFIESSGDLELNTDFEDPGVPITASAGDWCYDNECYNDSQLPLFPATAPGVISVGGTALTRRATERHWLDQVWKEPVTATERPKIGGTGSGCAAYEPKRSWEPETGCAHRLDNDVSAVAACETPVSMYYPTGWGTGCGTSAASPIIAAVEALSSSSARAEGAATIRTLGEEGQLFDVTEGHNYLETNDCESLFCNAGVGYDGPTGWGTPNGAFGTGGPVVFVTEAATAVGTISAELQGKVDLIGTNPSYRFEYGETEAYGHETETFPTSEGIEVSVSWLVQNLRPGTTYHYRLVATSAGKARYGADETFTTSEPFVEAKTLRAEAEQHSATLRGELDNDALGVEVEVEYYCQYGTSESLGHETTRSHLTFRPSFPDVEVTCRAEGLTAGTTYYYRLVAVTFGQTSFGAKEHFTTAEAEVAGPIAVQTGRAEVISGYFPVELTGTVNLPGTDPHYYFEYVESLVFYGEREGEVSLTPAVTIGEGQGYVNVSAIVEGLEPSDEYLFRLVGICGGITKYGEWESFYDFALLTRNGLPRGVDL